MADALTVKVTADTREAVAAVDELKSALEETKQEAKNVFAKGLSESLPEQLQDVAKGFRIAADSNAGFTTRLQGGVGAALIARTAMIDLAGRAVDLARAFGESRAAVEQEQRALRALGDNYASIRAATADTTTAAEALTMRQTLLRAGFQANADTLARVSRLGREYAQTYGGSATEAVNQFTAAIQSGDAAALQPFGVRLGQTKNSAERMSAAVEQLGERFSRTAAAGRTATEDAAAFDRGLARMRNETLTGLNRMFLHIPEGIHAAVTALGDMIPVERGVADATDHAARGLERQAEAARTTATATAALTSELSKADEALKAFENTLHDAPDYTLRANESYQEAVARNSAMALNAMNRARRTRDVQAGVLRSLGRVNNVDRAAAGLPTVQAQHSNLVPKWLTVSLEEKAAAEQERLSLLGSDEHQRMMRAKGIESDDAASAGLLGRDEYQRALRAKSFESDDLNAAGLMGRNEYGTALQGKQNENAELDAGNTFGARIGGAFRNTQTHAERTADSIKTSFDTMTQGLTGFMDTLIESPEKAGEASVALAKGVLKGIAMMALQKSLFSTAEGIAALAGGNFASAPGFFAAAGIYAGVAVAAGAGAAGIAASQRGATQATPQGSNGFGPARVDGGRGGGGGARNITINVNGTVMDKEGTANAVLDLLNDATARGGRLAA